MIRAAGALLWRERPDRLIELALIHRPRYDDWSLPKGKIEFGESALQCAFRELVEETGIVAKFTRQLGSVDYVESEQQKRVLFWAAQCGYEQGEFLPNEEVDEMRWFLADEAVEKASHLSDKEIISKFKGQENRTDTLIILRHTKALERGDWDQQDSLRPLSDFGLVQSQFLIKHLEPFAIDEIYTSDFTRCVQTVTPISLARNLSVTPVADLNENRYEEDPQFSISFANALKQDEKNILICSHNPVIPTMLRGVLNTSLKNKDLIKLEPGDAWIVHRVRGEIVGLDYLSIGI